MARLYISGPVTGIRDDNIEAFDKASIALDKAGYESYIPHDYIAEDADWHDAMLVSINRITRFDWWLGYKRFFAGLALLPGWEQSEGARLEVAVAEACGIPCKTVDEWIEEAR